MDGVLQRSAKVQPKHFSPVEIWILIKTFNTMNVLYFEGC